MGTGSYTLTAKAYDTKGAATVWAPVHVTVTPRGFSSSTWSTATSDPRALQKAIGSSRVAAAWYGQTFSLDVTITDGNAHPFSLYLLDWNTAARAQTIEVRDAVTNAVLDTRTVNGFNGGQYWRWTIGGHVTIRVNRTAGANAVISGWSP